LVALTCAQVEHLLALLLPEFLNRVTLLRRHRSVASRGRHTASSLRLR
jgi:hypothetical protein